MELTLDFLYNKFNAFNKLFFNNELPEIKIKISRTKAFGSFHYTYTRIDKNNVNNYTPVKIAISKLYNRSKNEIETTLIHEMIHYYICYKKIKDTGSHGVIWQKMANEISNKSKYRITECSPSFGLEINKKLNKVYYFVIFEYKGERYFSRVSKTYANYLKVNGHRLATIHGVFSTKETFFEKFSAKTNRLSLISMDRLLTSKYKEVA